MLALGPKESHTFSDDTVTAAAAETLADEMCGVRCDTSHCVPSAPHVKVLCCEGEKLNIAFHKKFQAVLEPITSSIRVVRVS